MLDHNINTINTNRLKGFLHIYNTLSVFGLIIHRKKILVFKSIPNTFVPVIDIPAKQNCIVQKRKWASVQL